jgi:hypothetical protein
MSHLIQIAHSGPFPRHEGVAAGLVRGGRLLRAELRRGLGPWLALISLPLAWLSVRDVAQLGVALWVDAALETLATATALVPLAAGFGAWAGGQDARRGLDELLGTVPTPGLRRDLARVAALAGWALAAYGLVAAYVVAQTARKATWGALPPGPVVVGGLAVAVGTAVGFAVGHWLPARSIAPLAALGALLSQTYVGTVMGHPSVGPEILYPLRWLSPMAGTQGSVWFGIVPDVAAQQALWLIGVLAVALAAVTLRRHRGTAAWAVLAAAVAAAGAAGAVLVDAAPRNWAELDTAEQAAIQRAGEPAWACSPVGATGQDAAPLTLCLHPAFSAASGEVAAEIAAVAGPVLGLPGVPRRAAQVSEWEPEGARSDAVTFHLTTWRGAPFSVAQRVVGQMVSNNDCQLSAEVCARRSEASTAIVEWLWRQSGRAESGPYPVYYCGQPGVADGPVCAATDRFAALPPEAQRAWLATNLAALRAGELTLEDIP